MKRSLILFVFIIGFSYGHAQQCPPSLYGTKTLYSPQQTVYTLPPAGYVPVFINHVGRHGARNLLKPVSATCAYRNLQKAYNRGLLTDSGKVLWKMIVKLDKVESPNRIKSISIRGQMEQEGIGYRLYKQYKPVVNKSAPLFYVLRTSEVRTQQSANYFQKGINKLNSAIRFDMRVNDTLLHFFSIAPAYLAFEKKDTSSWHKYYNEVEGLVDYNSLVRVFSRRFFRPGFPVADSISQITEDIFGFLTILPGIQQEIINSGFNPKELAIGSLFSCKELQALGKLDNVSDYLLKGPGTDAIGIQVKIAAPLLVNFIITLDSFIANQQRSAHFRFAHAETIAPFAAFLNIDSASLATTDMSNFDKLWKADRVAPLSANIQWIVYYNPVLKDYLVKVLLNEKEVPIRNVTSLSPPYQYFYSWKTLRSLYTDKLNIVKCPLTDSVSRLYEYLMDVK